MYDILINARVCCMFSYWQGMPLLHVFSCMLLLLLLLLCVVCCGIINSYIYNNNNNMYSLRSCIYTYIY